MTQIHRTLLIVTTYRDAALQLIVAAAGEGQAGMLQTPVQTSATYDEEGNELTPSEDEHGEHPRTLRRPSAAR